MATTYVLAILVISGVLAHVMPANAQSSTTTTVANLPEKPFEMIQDDLILLNVAAKGRVVELLANELARTEIIRALLVEYARECMENVTMLERYCLDCMMDRCSNRMSECNIVGPPISELINHRPSPIQGVQFLSQSPRTVDAGMREFANKARTDILKGVPETLREKGEAIMHAEVDQSLQDLNENMNTERALQKISVHVQKAADNVNKLPEVGDKLGTIIIENEDHAINLAELLARRLKDSRPFLESINHNGARVMEQMPAVIDEVGERVHVFKEKVAGVFNKVLNTFHRVMNDPETPVMNGNFPQPTIMGPTFNPQTLPFNPNMQGMNQFPLRQAVIQGPNGIQIPGVQFQGQIPQGQFSNQQFPGQGQIIQQRIGAQFPQSPMSQGQGQWPLNANQINMPQVPNGQQVQGQIIPTQMSQMQLQNMKNLINQAQFNAQELALQRLSNQISGSQAPPPQQGQGLPGRRRRHTDPDCQRLNDDPNTYCRTYESLCHNCTLEKRLRFEVCGEGVEKARDEIKRIDISVGDYLKAYEDYVAVGPLVLKVEFDTKNRLHKTNSFYDAFVTAKVGASIFRYKTKMIININEIRAAGLQIGDELWEKLWENGVFAEARKPEIVPDKQNIMGQVHIEKVHEAHAHSNNVQVPTGSASGHGVSWSYIFVSLFGLIFILV